MRENFFKNNDFPPNEAIFDFYPSLSGAYQEVHLYIGKAEVSSQKEQIGILRFKDEAYKDSDKLAIKEIFIALLNDIKERTNTFPIIKVFVSKANKDVAKELLNQIKITSLEIKIEYVLIKP